MGVHSASTLLDDIIEELRLKYDSSVGLLDGDTVREIPNLDTLQNLGKLLAKLSNKLATTETKDQALLLEVDAKLAEIQLAAEFVDTGKEEEEVDENESETEDNEDNGSEMEVEEEGEEEEELAVVKVEDNETVKKSGVKRERSYDEGEPHDNIDNEEEVEESMPLSKRRKVAAEEPEDEKTDDISVLEKDTTTAEIAEDDTTKDAEIKDQEKKEEPVEKEKEGDQTPLVQTGSYTQDNDTRLKNPRSEFVPAQMLSQAAITELGLFSEENNGLETQGKEYLKRKYGVASYPEHHLTYMLPGELSDHDFSKTKAPANQVQFSTYQSYIESYFRPFLNEDIAFISEKYVVPPGFDAGYDPLVSPYLVPKLGPFYTETWADEDAALGLKLSLPAFQRPPLEAYKPRGDAQELVEEKLVTEDVSCGPLSSRLLSAILSVHEVKHRHPESLDNGHDNNNGTENIHTNDPINDDGENASDTPRTDGLNIGEDLFGEDSATQLNAADTCKVTSDDTDFHSMEERLKRELKYIGIFTNTLPPLGDQSADANTPKKASIVDSDDWIVNREDDEICAEIRQLQGELKGAVVRNRKRKRALAPILEEHLAYQEFCTILYELDKQVDHAYTKRLKAKGRRKKMAPEAAAVLAQQQTANSGLKTLLEKRIRWIGHIGKLFEAPEVMKRIPKESVFSGQNDSGDEEGDAEVDVVNEDAS